MCCLAGFWRGEILLCDVGVPDRWAHRIAGAHHVDVKSGEGRLSVSEMAAGILSARPRWMVALWRIRVSLMPVLEQGYRGLPGAGQPEK